jgi:WD40 repeat protein
VSVATGTLVHELKATSDLSASITLIAFSPDGRRILASDCHPRTEVFDAMTGEHIRTIEGLGGLVAFSPDGSLVAGLGPLEDERRRKLTPTLRVVSLETFEKVAETPAVGGISALEFGPDGRSIVVGDDEGGVAVYELG